MHSSTWLLENNFNNKNFGPFLPLFANFDLNTVYHLKATDSHNGRYHNGSTILIIAFKSHSETWKHVF